jgi:hypothetical protein
LKKRIYLYARRMEEGDELVGVDACGESEEEDEVVAPMPLSSHLLDTVPCLVPLQHF